MKSVILGLSALAGALLLGILAATSTLLAITMGAILGATTAIACFAFPMDLDYRERRSRRRELL